MGKERRIKIRAVRREQPDIKRLGRALLALAAEQAAAEAAAQAEHEQSTPVGKQAKTKRAS